MKNESQFEQIFPKKSRPLEGNSNSFTSVGARMRAGFPLERVADLIDDGPAGAPWLEIFRRQEEEELVEA